MELAELSARHLEDVLSIETAVFKQPWSENAFKDVLSEGVPSWVAEENGQVFGYLISLWVEDEVHILNVATTPDRRRTGVATRLLDHLYQAAQRARMKTVFLEVRISNSEAISLYRKYGLGVLTVRKRYYADGEDAYVMCGPVKEQHHIAHPDSTRAEGDRDGD